MIILLLVILINCVFCNDCLSNEDCSLFKSRYSFIQGVFSSQNCTYRNLCIIQCNGSEDCSNYTLFSPYYKELNEKYYYKYITPSPPSPPVSVSATNCNDISISLRERLFDFLT